ncbi:hypothetical protein A6V29_07655 [Blastococcus sp. CCUG 61487]|nr:hypothetical protein A6V29_07655 [Blastococcus sp. CCUG 61487]
MCELVKEVTPDLVFHLAAEPDRGAALDSEDPSRAVTYMIAKNLADVLPSYTRVVSVGSAKQYGPRSTHATESEPQRPMSLYGQVKALAEVELARLPGCVSLRLGPVYGPGQPATGFIPVVLDRCCRGRDAFEVDPYLWSPLYIDDAVQALMATGLALGVEGSTFNVASPETRSLADIAHVCAVECGWPLEEARERISASPGSYKGYLIDARRFATRLGWRPKVSLGDGIARCARHTRREENGE